MGKPAVSLRTNLISLCAAVLLVCGLAPFNAFAEDSEPAGARVSVAATSAVAASEKSAEGATPNYSIAAGNEGSVLASTLAGPTSSIVSADVILDTEETVVGSFTVDGLTYALDNGEATLISVACPFTGHESEGSAEGGFTDISIPATVTYNNTIYPVTSVAPYAFYLSGATSVELPATITSVDSRAFRSSDVERVTVDAANPNLASFEGALYSADESRLLLIPEGRKGSVLLSCETEVAELSVFSHCSLVDAIAVEEGGAAFSSWEGLLYDASGETLLRVPAGATEITIRDGCTTIAAGALEGCAKLERINAPASVTSISPDVFTSVPTVSLPATAITQDEPVAASFTGAESAPADNVASVLTDQSNASTIFASQLTAMVALSSLDADLLQVNPASITVFLPDGAPHTSWERVDVNVESVGAAASGLALQEAASYAANTSSIWITYPFDSDELYAASYSSTSSGALALASAAQRLDGAYKTLGWSCVSNTDFAGYRWCDQGFAYKGKANGWSALYRDAGRKPLTRAFLATYTGFQSWPSGTFMTLPQVRSDMREVAKKDVDIPNSDNTMYYFVFDPYYVATWDVGEKGRIACTEEWGVTQSGELWYDGTLAFPEVEAAPGLLFAGWTPNADRSAPEGGYIAAGESVNIRDDTTYYAAYKPGDFDVSFDTSTEPGDESYPGEAKPDETINVDAGQVAIEDPKRPGYVFEGWVIPNADGTEAVDQDLVYQDDDGKWYVDASKLPDYAGDDGRVELTARWTSVISVDVPQSVTFYADTVTQNQGSREGAASSAFGQNKVANQSQVDLRVVGLESEAVETTDTTLGADSILKKAEAATPSTSAGKLLSLYPSAKQWTADELQDPDAVGGTKAANAVDFDLDDILLEKSFAADAFTIEAGKTLNMGYRLNLAETGQQLDYDKLSTLEDGQSAAIANVSYCFAGEHVPTATGSVDDDFYIEHQGHIYGPSDIKASAECLSDRGDDSPCYDLYSSFLESGMDPSDPSDAHGYVKWGDGVTYNVRIIGINHDDKSDGTGKAGLTFQFASLLDSPYYMNYPTCGSTAHYGNAANNYNSANKGFEYGTWDVFYDTASSYNFWSHSTSEGGWGKSLLRQRMNPGVQPEGLNPGSAQRDDDAIWNQVPEQLQDTIAEVSKHYYDGPFSLPSAVAQVRVSHDKLFIASFSELVSESDTYPTGWIGAVTEGSPYEYWKRQAISGNAANPSLSMARPSSSDSWIWWLRTCVPSDTARFIGVYANGAPNDPWLVSTHIMGVAPTFCL